MKGEIEAGLTTHAPKSTVGEGPEPVADIKEGIAVVRNSAGQCYIGSAGGVYYGMSWNVPDDAGEVTVKHAGLRKFYGDGVAVYSLDQPLKIGDNGTLVPFVAATDDPEELVGYVEEVPFSAGAGEEEDDLGWARLVK